MNRYVLKIKSFFRRVTNKKVSDLPIGEQAKFVADEMALALEGLSKYLAFALFNYPGAENYLEFKFKAGNPDNDFSVVIIKKGRKFPSQTLPDKTKEELRKLGVKV